MYKKFLGTFIGGAAGDALGYPVEFDTIEKIQEKYGKNGITEFILSPNKEALISDDTQMTLFTANGLITGLQEKNTEKILSNISLSYLDWYNTQIKPRPEGVPLCAWIANIPQLYDLRAPGITCLNSCMKGANGSIASPINNSKGCGGIMRVAPIGLLPTSQYSLKEIAILGAEVSALTHGNIMGYIPSAILTCIINKLVYSSSTPEEAIYDSISFVKEIFPQNIEIDNLLNSIKNAIYLANNNFSDKDCVRGLGEGWTADEALLIAIYCAVKYSNDFERAIIAAVNHSGDSDSTGSITGNILGAYLGIDKIPKKFTENLEIKNLIKEIVLDLYWFLSEPDNEPLGEAWNKKYKENTYGH